jgi:hypothetical protein
MITGGKLGDGKVQIAARLLRRGVDVADETALDGCHCPNFGNRTQEVQAVRRNHI